MGSSGFNSMSSVRREKVLAFSLALLFLVIHAVMYFVFRHNNIPPLAILNLASVTFYVGMLILILNDKLYEFVVASFVEICFHMAVTIYCTGWNSGFQVTLIGICVLLAYVEYIGRTGHMKYPRLIVLGPVAMITYLVSFYYTIKRPAPYPLPEHVSNIFQVAWALIVFGNIFVVMQIFVNFAASSQEKLSYEALHDKLTGLPNRVYMSEYLKKVFAKSDNEKYWLAITDLDDFKLINDTYGHNCGDYVLVTIANLLKSPGIEVCRWGGEEFLLVGKKVNNGPAALLQQIRQSVHDYNFQYENHQIHVTLTIGMSWLQSEMTLDQWISSADKKLYEGKAAGKDRLCM